MSWYAAHLVMCVRFRSGAQDKFPVWENVVLLSARSDDEAFAQAEAMGRSAAGDEDPTFKWGRRAARWEFVGVRKLVACALAGPSPAAGDEVTYTELEFDSLSAVQAFAAGGPARARFEDQFPAAATTQEEQRKRKRA
jgi:hypothetical protein